MRAILDCGKLTSTIVAVAMVTILGNGICRANEKNEAGAGSTLCCDSGLL
jgi:hypothetical protein